MKNHGTGFERQNQLFSKALAENISDLKKDGNIGSDLALSLKFLLQSIEIVAYNSKGNYGILYSSLKEYITALKLYPSYDRYISRYLTYINFLERDPQINKIDKKIERPGVVCMNLKTGMVYISK